MKTFIKETFCLFLYFFYRLTHKLPKISSVYFHDPSPELFEMVLKWFKKHKYRVVSLVELERLLDKKEVPNERVAFISFDDGWRSNMQLLPICEKYNTPITVFVATEPLISGNYWWEYVTKKLGRTTMLSFKAFPEEQFYKELAKVKEGMSLSRSSMTQEDLKMFANHPLVTIGSHTVKHPVLTNAKDDTLRFELTESKKELESLIGCDVESFSYPNGNVGKREIDALKEAGYKYAFTTEAKEFDVENYNPFLLPRMSMNTNGGKYDNLAKLTGIWYSVVSRLHR